VYMSRRLVYILSHMNPVGSFTVYMSRLLVYILSHMTPVQLLTASPLVLTNPISHSSRYPLYLKCPVQEWSQDILHNSILFTLSIGAYTLHKFCKNSTSHWPKYRRQLLMSASRKPLAVPTASQSSSSPRHHHIVTSNFPHRYKLAWLGIHCTH
jgi:hypothetical protein